MKKLKILTTSTCGRCKKIKPVLQEICASRGIEYEELMVPAPAALEMARQYGATSAPFILYYDGVSEEPREYRNIHDVQDVTNMFKEID